MSLLSFFFFAVAGLLLFVFVWSISRPSRGSEKIRGLRPQRNDSRPHVGFMPQIRHALDSTDIDFVVRSAGKPLANRVRRERKRVTLSYLDALQGDFDKLLEQAKLIAVLSPEVVAMHEFERVRLSIEFSLRCRWIRTRLLFGSKPIMELGRLSDVVSGLAVRVEAAMRELAERAAAAAALASPIDRRGIDSI
jgi:protein involved in temperature-dependent protein secretion